MSLYVERATAQTLKFLDTLFEARKYRKDTKKYFISQKHNIFYVTIEDDSGCKVLCILTPVKSDISNIHDIFELTATVLVKEIMEGITKTDTVGSDFIKAIVKYRDETSTTAFVIVCNMVTSHALRAISMAGLKVSHFKYSETTAYRLSTHISQPITMKKLKSKEMDNFKRLNPLYFTELNRCSVLDPLSKMLGFEVGDIVELKDTDPQSGEVVDYLLVVQNE